MTTDNPVAALPDPATLPYEAAKAELKQIVQALEAGSIPLENTLELWQRGEALAGRCKAILDAASAQIEAVTNQQ
ncbi:exodeoxyribonuclease VII small subunit [Actinomyces minihominis]|uniref:exodeoxyribonuclease VII small subunit n=1 Tax=Actinomyces minihominis TaxID=2002838 RepID=UPI000C074E7F|nr:exodeoxyribonuclease VII small subunit [Actinomyces minihominis]